MAKTQKNVKNKIDKSKSHKYIFSINDSISKKSNSQIDNGIGISLSTVRILPEDLRNNKEVVLKAIETDQSYINSISKSLKDDIDVAKKIIEKKTKRV
jgi:hypothetical protein